MPIIKISQTAHFHLPKYKSTKDANVLYITKLNQLGRLQYQKYNDVIFSTKFLSVYELNTNIIPTTLPLLFNQKTYFIIDNTLRLNQVFTMSIIFYLQDLYKQQILLTNNDDFCLSINPIGYNNCIVLKIGQNVIYQKNVLKQKKINKVVYRCNGSVLESFVNHNIKKQPIENLSVQSNNFSIGCKYVSDTLAKGFIGRIEQLSLYSSYKNNTFIAKY